MSQKLKEIHKGRERSDGYICGICGREYEDERDALECYHSCVVQIEEVCDEE